VKDERLLRVFDRLDADKNGEVTLEEIRKVSAQMEALQGGGRGRGERGPDGPGRPPEGRGGFGPPQPGQLLPGPLADMLNISPEQREKIEKLQRETNDKLEGILTAEQRDRLREVRERMRGFNRPGEPGRPPEGRGERRPDGDPGRAPEGRGERRPDGDPGRPPEGRGERRPGDPGRPPEGRGDPGRAPEGRGEPGRPPEGRGERRPGAEPGRAPEGRGEPGRPPEGRGERRPGTEPGRPTPPNRD
jgi:hypothetical protein